MTLTGESLSNNVSLLKAKASKHAIAGVLISSVALIAATMLSGYLLFGEVSAEAFLNAQKTNAVLWIIDGMPFLFALWGQYVSSMMAYEAGAMVIDQTEELRAKTTILESKAMHDATHDYLTGLPNRILFLDRLEQALNVARANDKKLAVMLLDLDRFKEINNTLGHYNGDKVLKQVAARFGELKQAGDTLARMGGDEFAFLLPEIKDEQDLRNMVARIRKVLIQPFMIEGLSLDVQASIGVAIFPEHGTEGDTLIQRADVARYVAKEARNGFVIYSFKHDQYSPQRLTLMGELRQGIENGELFLMYQPKINGASGKIKAAEALIRWKHYKHGIIPPDDFIPMAERTGIIKDLSKYVVKTVLEQIAAWQTAGHDISVSVNLSAQDLLDPELPDVLAGLLAAHEVPASRLIVEITETAIIADPELALQVMFRLASMGVKMSIDDFGTGYSSLSYLKKMPVNEIKIDRSFVMDMMENRNDEVIVKATIGLAHNLDLEVVAEGVEDQASADRLNELGCDSLQGFFFSKPLIAEEFIGMVRQSKDN
ncbi:MAG: EAL domain-containing protein [Desulfobulbaceae bacterium]|nr:EAL domain-containing protein [Desulfobulbaceae bacterium]